MASFSSSLQKYYISFCCLCPPQQVGIAGPVSCCREACWGPVMPPRMLPKKRHRWWWRRRHRPSLLAPGHSEACGLPFSSAISGRPRHNLQHSTEARMYEKKEVRQPEQIPDGRNLALHNTSQRVDILHSTRGSLQRAHRFSVFSMNLR